MTKQKWDDCDHDNHIEINPNILNVFLNFVLVGDDCPWWVLSENIWIYFSISILFNCKLMFCTSKSPWLSWQPPHSSTTFRGLVKAYLCKYLLMGDVRYLLWYEIPIDVCCVKWDHRFARHSCPPKQDERRDPGTASSVCNFRRQNEKSVILASWHQPRAICNVIIDGSIVKLIDAA